MGLDTIPAIPADYPLYDWADWQSSRDALVEGGPTKYFAKEAWNAIVDELADAITAAGQEWDTTYTTAAGAKITVAYGKLSARAFNSVRLNIDRQMHLAWPWAEDPENRGYVGREDFRGRQDVGKACDLVFPEYILELVRKLNLLLEIMRGTGPICDAESERQSGAQIDADAKAGIGAPATYTHHATLLINVTANTGKAAYVACRAPLLIAQAVRAVSGIGAPIYYSRMISVPISVAGQSKQGVQMRVLPLSYMTSVYAEAMSCLPIPFGASCGISCGANAAARLAMPLPATVNGVMALSYVSAEPQLGTSLPTSARTMASSTASVGKIDFLRSAPVVCAGGSRSKASCNMSDTAWLPPVWVNGGLWIRQVHDDPVQRDNGDLEVT